MKDLLLVTLALAATSAVARYETYEPIVEQLYFNGNDARNDPTVLADKCNGEPADYVRSRDKGKNLIWSDGLARSCRDLILDIGPYGLEGHTTSGGKDEFDRAAIYTSSSQALEEVLVYTDLEDISNSEREAWEVYEKMMSNPHEREALFHPEFTHVGISCGCHQTHREVCCFAYGKTVVDKHGVDTKDVMMVNPSMCDRSQRWSDRLTTGESYQDVEADMPDALKPTGPAGPEVATFPNDETYETVSRKVFNSYKLLADDKADWLEGVNDYKAIQEAKRFRQVDIRWSDSLAALALNFENEAAPCDSEVNEDGDSLLVYVLDHIDDYDELHMVSYEGPFVEDPKEVIIDQLKKGRFDDDQFYGRFDELGVGCTCNGAKGMECLMIFGGAVKLNKKLTPEFTQVVERADCMARCQY